MSEQAEEEGGSPTKTGAGAVDAATASAGCGLELWGCLNLWLIFLAGPLVLLCL